MSKTSQLFDPETSLINLKPVRWCFWTAIGLCSLTVIAIATKAFALSFDFSGDGFNRLIDLYKVPLGILATGLAVIGILGANHRSEQTKRQIQRTSHQIDLTTKQIELSRDQNNFSNYFKHIEEFEKYRETLKSDLVEVKKMRNIHSRIFPGARDGNFRVDDVLAGFFALQLERLYLHFERMSTADHNKLASLAFAVINLREELSAHFSIYTKRTSGGHIVTENGNFTLPGNNMVGLFLSVREVIDAIDSQLKFDRHYVSSEVYDALMDQPYGVIFPVGNGLAPFEFSEQIKRPKMESG